MEGGRCSACSILYHKIPVAHALFHLYSSALFLVGDNFLLIPGPNRGLYLGRLPRLDATVSIGPSLCSECERSGNGMLV